MGHKEHEAEAPKQIKIGIITLSDTRTIDEDESGKLLKTKLTDAGHSITKYSLIREEPTIIFKTFVEFLYSDLDAVIANGGTGLSSRDGTIEIARKLLVKELPGFGEIFRWLSYNEIGPAAMLSRAIGGLAINNRILLCLPGSTNAVKLAIEKLLLPQLPHLIREIRR